MEAEQAIFTAAQAIIDRDSVVGVRLYEGNAYDDKIRLRAAAAHLRSEAPSTEISRTLERRRYLNARKQYHQARHETAGRLAMEATRQHG